MKILLAGATGYLGVYIAKEIRKRSWYFRVVVRNPEKLEQNGIRANEVLKAELTDPGSIRGCCKDINVVISTVGITRQKDGLTYMDVDYQANMNLLKEATESGVEKFIYVSVLNGEKLRDLKICDAKEMFVEQLRKSGLEYCIIRPNGFFSDISEYFRMAKRGRVYLFGNGTLRANPIHGEDLATVCVEAISKPDKEVEVGGPEIRTQNEIVSLAFDILGTKPKIIHVPNWVRITLLHTIRLLSGVKIYGPVEFFLSVIAMDMLAPKYGHHTLREYFSSLHESNVL